MKKSPEAFRTISEVAEELSIPAHVLRFWETKFHQISPVKRGGGRRYYRPDDVRLLRSLQKLLHGDGLTIKGAQKLLRENGLRSVISLGDIGPDLAPHPDEPQDDLARIYTALTQLRRRVAAAAAAPKKTA